MATLGSPPRGRKSFAKRVERCCSSCLIVFPLTFVYGLTTWAMWVQTMVGLEGRKGAWAGSASALLGVAFWVLLNWSYTTAVFTDPGSPLTTRQDPYLPLSADEGHAPVSLTVKSTGEPRFCKKCQSPKPDRAHHCSTCKRCVLKMDHHCPWLATCVGFRNYKPFLLFLIYVCLFCWVCFVESASWFWAVLLTNSSFDEGAMPVNYILLSVISGVIGLVLTGFTGWHVYLAMTGQTTIESLEKTRWTTNVKRSMQRHFADPGRHATNPIDDPSLHNIGARLAEIHANALPGVLRPEEGVDDDAAAAAHATPAHEALRRNYELAERRRERDRYASYLEEQDSERLPHAFDHGWRRNLTHVFGPSPLLWALPVCNTTGDGWTWAPTERWTQARDDMAREREARMRENAALNETGGAWVGQGARVDPRAGFAPPPRFTGPAHRAQAGPPPSSQPPPQQTPGEPDYSSDDDEPDDRQRLVQPDAPGTSNWNDIPDGFLDNNRRNIAGARSPRPQRYQRPV